MKEDNIEGGFNGDLCNRNGCDGIIIHEREGGCCCHINPPCSYCTDDSAYCPKCHWEDRETPKAQNINSVHQTKSPVEVLDDGKLYEIRRYFDDHFEAVVESGLTIREAIKRRDYYNSKPRCYVQYSFYEMINSDKNPERSVATTA